MWVAKRRHDLDFSSNVNHVLFIFNLFLLDRLDGNLKRRKSFRISNIIHNNIVLETSSNLHVILFSCLLRIVGESQSRFTKNCAALHTIEDFLGKKVSNRAVP